ncbi:hypothetical protein KC660_00945, partial [Candidatus Dojkabacteria bacterium]|nr:hypothetical protein [Candidatus Dojkabacteria bacterium]
CLPAFGGSKANSEVTVMSIRNKLSEEKADKFLVLFASKSTLLSIIGIRFPTQTFLIILTRDSNGISAGVYPDRNQGGNDSERARMTVR